MECSKTIGNLDLLVPLLGSFLSLSPLFLSHIRFVCIISIHRLKTPQHVMRLYRATLPDHWKARSQYGTASHHQFGKIYAVVRPEAPTNTHFRATKQDADTIFLYEPDIIYPSLEWFLRIKCRGM